MGCGLKPNTGTGTGSQQPGRTGTDTVTAGAHNQRHTTGGTKKNENRKLHFSDLHMCRSRRLGGQRGFERFFCYSFGFCLAFSLSPHPPLRLRSSPRPGFFLSSIHDTYAHSSFGENSCWLLGTNSLQRPRLQLVVARGASSVTGGFFAGTRLSVVRTFTLGFLRRLLPISGRRVCCVRCVGDGFCRIRGVRGVRCVDYRLGLGLGLAGKSRHELSNGIELGSGFARGESRLHRELQRILRRFLVVDPREVLLPVVPPRLPFEFDRFELEEVAPLRAPSVLRPDALFVAERMGANGGGGSSSSDDEDESE